MERVIEPAQEAAAEQATQKVSVPPKPLPKAKAEKRAGAARPAGRVSRAGE